MTKYIKEQDLKEEQIIEIGKSIKNGKIVVFKTDTVYGIGTNAYLKDACQKIYEIKNRPKHKPLCVLISDISMLKEFVNEISPLEQKLMNAFWPGPMTIKFKKKENIFPELISAGDDYIRVRLIKSGIAYKLIQSANVPIVAPSANLSGNPTGIKIENIWKELNEKVDYIIDSNDVLEDTPSTIVEVVNEKVVVIREGKIKKAQIKEIENS